MIAACVGMTCRFFVAIARLVILLLVIRMRIGLREADVRAGRRCRRALSTYLLASPMISRRSCRFTSDSRPRTAVTVPVSGAHASLLTASRPLGGRRACDGRRWPK